MKNEQYPDLEQGDNYVFTDTNQRKYTSHVKYQEKTTGCLVCCSFFSIGIPVMALIVGMIAYLVYGIIYLVQDYKIAKDCSSSNLWAYVLVTIILCWTRTNVKNSFSNEGDFGTIICTLVCLGLIEGGLATWGGIELWKNSCSELSNSNLWKFGLVTFCLQTFCASIFLVIMPLIVLCFT